MKRLSLLLVMLISVAFVNAHGNHGHYGSKKGSELNLKLWNNSSFKVVLNNQEYGRNQFFTKKYLTPGIHKLEVFKVKRNRHGHGFLRQLLYRGSVRVPVNSKVMATVSPNKKLQVKVVKNKPNWGQGHGPSGYGNNHSGYGSSHGHNGCMDQCCSGPAIYGMNELSFNHLMNAVENENFDSYKLNVVEQALSMNYFTTEQVAMLMGQFTFDSNKLKLAKMAYDKTLDKQNYFMVNSQFTFNSSIASLNKYIQQYG